MFKKRKAEKSAAVEIRDKKRGERWLLALPSLHESRENLVNPWRGWYQIFSFKAEERPDFEELKWCLRAEESLVLIRMDIGAFVNRDLSEALGNMTDILSFFSKAGKGVILRVVYDTAGRGMKREPANFEKVKEHLTTLKPLIARFSEDILVYQGLLVGSWGEMHDSAYLSPRHLRELMKILLGIEGRNCYFAVRTPAQWRQLVSEKAFLTGLETHISLFDDGMFGSENHLGTFGTKAEAEAVWEEAWRKKDELMFEREICAYAPSGGEAVGALSSGSAVKAAGIVPMETFMEEKAALPELGEVSEQMRFMHTVYLNSVYDKRILDIWRGEVWKSKDVWNGVSGYDYIGCRLGYRFVIRKAVVREEKKRGEKEGFGAELALEIENIGFGAFPRIKKNRLALEIEAEGEIVWREYFSTKEYPLPGGGEKTKICLPFSLFNGALYFRLEALVREQVYTVYFGNAGGTEKGLRIANIRKS